ncbi:MAG: peptide chain release factor-like protein [Planctomycetota bacterium]|nr:peptide chain release factor-like protein [Planctomycetota bacterium]
MRQIQKFGIREKDIVESFISSGGPGGQNVNKTATCVYLKHLPTGIEVKCQQERSQALNRLLARQILIGKIEKHYQKQVEEKRRLIEKIRRQKRKPPRYIQLRRLCAKRRLSLKKQNRSFRPTSEEV